MSLLICCYGIMAFFKVHRKFHPERIHEYEWVGMIHLCEAMYMKTATKIGIKVVAM